ncbi:TlpA disulfide reductase family protein [Maribacter sp. 2307ULW6-5]|uniref:TlpA disulfide reductase family protein n=1 Tax=Maribacter sp. 2307ULW6-5 TaxID=3386275 RepID=UPI0039BD4918
MRIFFFLFLSCFLCASCAREASKAPLNEGIWQGQLTLMEGRQLPFNFKVLNNDQGRPVIEIYNAEEVILVEDVWVEKDSIRLQPPVFEGYIAGRFTDSSMVGTFVKESLDRELPFRATYGQEERFSGAAVARHRVSGVWEMDFAQGGPDAFKGKGIFNQDGNAVTGTIRTTTGDYRFLDGVMDGDSLRLSTFDGSRAFLFTAKATDSTLRGHFHSDNHYKQPFFATRNLTYELPSSDSLTFLREGYKELSFRFPDREGKQVSLKDERFRDKVVIVQIMGTWCPNCLDETRFLVDFLKESPKEDLAIVGLAFEYSKTEEKAWASIDRLVERVGVPYPILLAQFGTSDKEKAQEKLPMLNRVISYPTTIYIDKKGAVRKIHTGFNGPATGVKYEQYKEAFHTFVDSLLKE